MLGIHIFIIVFNWFIKSKLDGFFKDYLIAIIQPWILFEIFLFDLLKKLFYFAVVLA